MIKILHTADIHLDAPLRSLALRDEGLRAQVQVATRMALTRIVDAALTHEVAALLIAGDLFDGAERSARTAAFLTTQLDRLRTAGIRVFYIKGNHDAENPITGDVTLPDNVHVFDGRGGKEQLTPDVWIHGVSFAGRQAPDSLLPKFAAPVPGAVNIAMLHTSIAGAAGHDVYAPCTLSDLTSMGFDYWALGHIHKRQVHATVPMVVMPGTPQGRDIGEAGPKTATLITVDDGNLGITEIPTSAAEFLALSVDTTSVDSDDALRDLLRADLRAAAQALQSDVGILRVTLTGQSPRRWQIQRDAEQWRETLQSLAQETGRLWLDKLALDLTSPEAKGHGATDELATMMQAIRAEPGFDQAISEDLTALLAELPAQRRARLLPDADSAAALGQSLAQAGAAQVVAAMKGARD